MKKYLFTLLMCMMVGVQLQGQQMNLALKIADYAMRVDVKTGKKVLKREGFKKFAKIGNTTYFHSKEYKMDAMIIASGDYVGYLKFLFPELPSANEIDNVARQCGYQLRNGVGVTRIYRKGQLVLNTSKIANNKDYIFGFEIKYEPQ